MKKDMKKLVKTKLSKTMGILAAVLILLPLSCAENVVDPEDSRSLLGDWILTRVTQTENNQTFVNTPDEIKYYIFLNLFEDEVYDYMVLDENGLHSGTGDWQMHHSTITFHDFLGKDFSGVYDIKLNQFTVTSDEGFPIDADRFTFEYTYDEDNTDPRLVGEWYKIRTDYYTSNGDYSITPAEESKYVNLYFYADGYYVDEVINRGNPDKQTGTWNVVFDILRTYYDNGELIVNRYKVEGNRLKFIIRTYDEKIGEVITLEEIYEKE